MTHNYEAICDHTNNSPEDIDNNVLNIDVVRIDRPGAEFGWVRIEDIERLQREKLRHLGISEEFLSGEKLAPGEMYVCSPSFFDRTQTVTKVLENVARKIGCCLFKPQAVRGGAMLRHNKMKFRSLRLARLWWKEHMLNNPDFDWKQWMPKGELGTMQGMTVHSEPIPRIVGIEVITDAYRGPKND